MNRRGFLGGLVALVAGAAAMAPTRRYGPMTIARHRALQHQGVHLHVFHYGRDVTLNCSYADDTGEGMAHVFLRNADGRFYLDSDGSAARDTVHGVMFQEGAPFR